METKKGTPTLTSTGSRTGSAPKLDKISPTLLQDTYILLVAMGSYRSEDNCLFVFVALRPMSTAMVIAGQSVHLTTLFPGQA